MDGIREQLAKAHFDAWRAINPGLLTWETFGEEHKQRFYDTADVSLAFLSSAGDVQKAPYKAVFGAVQDAINAAPRDEEAGAITDDLFARFDIHTRF